MGASRLPCRPSGARGLGGELVGRVGGAVAVEVDGEGVDAGGVGDEVEVLAGVADGVGSAEPEGVVERAVDAFGVIAAGEEPGEVGVTGWDGSDV